MNLPLIFLSCDHNENRPMRVLMVEDDVKMAGLVRRGLVEDGHAADLAGTGEDALWMARAHPYDAIVLDVMLPGLSGFETCKRLRDAGVWSPVLMLTAVSVVAAVRLVPQPLQNRALSGLSCWQAGHFIL